MHWFHNLVIAHTFADNSGSVFFHLQSGETLAVKMSLSDIVEQLSEPSSMLRHDEIVMPRMKIFLSDAAISKLSPSDDI
jgi:hypothetical protein